MNTKDMKKGTQIVTYIFPENTTTIADIEVERMMRLEMAQLMNSWKERGYLKRWLIASEQN